MTLSPTTCRETPPLEWGVLADTNLLPALITSKRCAIPVRGDLLREVGEEYEGQKRFRTFDGATGPQIHVGGIGVFWIVPDGSQIRYALDPNANLDDVHHILVGPVVGLALQSAQVPVLHASCFAVGNSAVALSAPSGMGKSTLGAYLGKSGFPLISDDMLIVNHSSDPISVHPFLPKIKLWDDTLEGLGEDPATYQTTMTWLEKRKVDTSASWLRVANSELPLNGIYLLKPHPRGGAAVDVESVSPGAAVVTLMAAMYMPETLRGPRAVAALDAATRIAETVPVRTISYHRSYENLPAIRDAILRDVEGLTNA